MTLQDAGVQVKSRPKATLSPVIGSEPQTPRPSLQQRHHLGGNQVGLCQERSFRTLLDGIAHTVCGFDRKVSVPD